MDTVFQSGLSWRGREHGFCFDDLSLRGPHNLRSSDNQARPLSWSANIDWTHDTFCQLATGPKTCMRHTEKMVSFIATYVLSFLFYAFFSGWYRLKKDVASPDAHAHVFGCAGTVFGWPQLFISNHVSKEFVLSRCKKILTQLNGFESREIPCNVNTTFLTLCFYSLFQVSQTNNVFPGRNVGESFIASGPDPLHLATTKQSVLDSRKCTSVIGRAAFRTKVFVHSQSKPMCL